MENPLMEPRIEILPRQCVFISHSSHDAASANALADALEAQGVACWIAPRDVPPGTRYAAAIIDGITACTAMVLLLSEQSNASPQVLAEIERAVSKGLSIFTLRLEPVTLTKSLEYFLSAFHWIDVFPSPLEGHLERIVAAVRQNLGTSAAAEAMRVSRGTSVSAPAREYPNNLPAQVTSFIGRENELADVKALLMKARLLTLTGAGGAGKTRLSLHAAAGLLTGDGDGVWLVELAPLTDPALVPQAVAEVLGIQDSADKTLTKSLVEDLKEKRLLLILDNCEHLLAACASLAADLLRSCPGVHILASSRERLGVPGEQVYRVPSLSLPDPKQAQTALSLPQYEAARLMIERAQAVRPDFLVTDRNADAVAQVCHRLDGIPLAIELAAARVRSLSVEEVNTRLDNRFRILTGGSKTLLPRQQTLRALIDWSYDLLTDQEKTLLCHLSVFMGGWCLEAAESVGAGGEVEDWEVLDVLTSLVDKSLVIAEASGYGMRYRMLESIRQYALERLQADGSAEVAVRARHAAWCLSLAAKASPMLRGPEAKTWLSRLDLEHDNLRAALTLTLNDLDAGFPTQDPNLVWRLIRILGDFWYQRGYLSEGRRWTERALAGNREGIEPILRFSVLRWAGVLASIQCDYALAQTRSEEALALAREMGDRKQIAKMLGDLGTLSFVQGDFATAQVLYDQSLELHREIGDRPGMATMLTNSGLAASKFGNYEVAEARHRESLELFRAAGNKRAMAFALNGLASVAQSRGDVSGAQRLYEQTRELFEEIGDKREATMSSGNIGMMAYFQGDYATAKARLEAAIPAMRELGDPRNATVFLTSLGQVLIMLGDLGSARATFDESLDMIEATKTDQSFPELLRAYADLGVAESRLERAARLHGAADAMATVTGERLAPFFAAEKERLVSAVRAMLVDDEAFATAYAAGQALPRDQILKLARTRE